MIDKEVRKQQIQILDVYKEAAKEDESILPFLNNLSKRLLAVIEEIDNNSKEETE